MATVRIDYMDGEIREHEGDRVIVSDSSVSIDDYRIIIPLNNVRQVEIIREETDYGSIP